MWFTWNLSVAAGIFIGAMVPPAWSLDFAIPLVFLSLLVPALQTRRHFEVALVAGVAAAYTAALPLKLGLIVSAAIAIALGAWREGRKQEGATA